jgi:superfamily II DNA or RNA helicase
MKSNKVVRRVPVAKVPKIVTSLQQPNACLGTKGYSVQKSDLTADELTDLKKTLIAKPQSQGGFGPNVPVRTFPIFRESGQRIYMPRHFGEKAYGFAPKMRVSQGEEMIAPFAGELRDNQVPVVNAYLEHVAKDPEQGGGGLLELPCAYGKTTLALYICAQLRVKTLVIVHKEFLLNQWIERIHQFLPTARVGKIQGSTVDVDNKDIVIGMLQSLSMKDYPADTFTSFGLMVIDEVHHISSEVFSCALFKVVTKYTMGLSATMNRKDGTTKVFKMFLGDVVYKGERDEEHDVIVRAIQYRSTDTEFSRVETDYMGKVKYSTMIVKLCAFSPRSEFILRVLSDMVAENPEQQIMILAHNKSVLKYLHDAIRDREIATVGYYVGGMKEAALKESEGKKVIIATYSMASEALDIKTLTTLIMATPKTDIEQAVGRILRQKHTSPIVVDIIDSHEVFVRQWYKRCAFYKKNGYTIVQTSFDAYTPDVSQWTNKRTPVKAKAKAGAKAGAGAGAGANTHESVIAMLNRNGLGGATSSADLDMELEPGKIGTEDTIFSECFISMNK